MAPPTSPSPTDALRLLPRGAEPLSAAARAYHLQLARIDKLNGQMAEMDALATVHREALTTQVFPLAQRQQALMNALALQLDQHFRHAPRLPASQRQLGTQRLCDVARSLVAQGHADMAAVHDRHSPKSLAELERDHTQALKNRLESLLGEALLPDQPDANANDVMRAARARMQQVAEKHHAQKADRQAKRQAKRDAKHQAKNANTPHREAQPSQARLQDDADSRLRTLYRQLASALHPDREHDPDAHLRKTTLMSEANAAYARKDYVTLMDIQQRTAPTLSKAVAPLSDDQLQALTLLLKAQVAALERQRAQTQQGLVDEFGLSPGMPLNAHSLNTLLKRKTEDLQHAVAALQGELALLQQDKGLQRWLAEPRKHQPPRG